MRHHSKLDWVLIAVAVLAAVMTIYFRHRYGEIYHFGDSEYRRTGLWDELAFVGPALVAATSVGLFALRRIAGGSLVAHWRLERELLSAARRY